MIRTAFISIVLITSGAMAAAQDTAVDPGPDTLAFTRGGSVWLLDVASGKGRKLGVDLGYDRPLTWSPDGRHLLAWRHSEIGWDVWRITNFEHP